MTVGNDFRTVLFRQEKNIKANIKKIITKLNIPEKYIFPGKYYIKSKEHRSQMKAYILILVGNDSRTDPS